MHRSRSIPLSLILSVLLFLPSCGSNNSEPMVEMNRYDHRNFGIIRVCFLRQPQEIQSWPCKTGKVRFFENGKLLSLTLDQDHLFQGDTLPGGSRVTLFQNGHLKFLRLAGPATIQGNRVSGSNLFSGRVTSFYGDGSLKSFRPSGNFTMDGLPVSDQQDTELYPDGQIMVCRLHEDLTRGKQHFTAGSTLLFDEHRNVYVYSSEMHAAIHSHFGLEKYLDEKLLHVYELRMSGRTKQAHTAIRNLEKEGGFNPLIHYEKSRIKRSRFLGGAPGESYESILRTSVVPTYMDRHNVTFCYFDGDCASWAAHGKLSEGDSLMARGYFLRAIERFERCLQLDPGLHMARLSLIQHYARLPRFLGGNMDKANLHRAFLEKRGPVENARAASMYLTDRDRQLDLWLDLHAEYPEDPEVMRETGRAFLLSGDPVNAEVYYRKAVEKDPTRIPILLDVARAFLESTDRLGRVPSDQIQRAELLLHEVLESEPVQPVKAWCFGQLARCKDMRGIREEAEDLRKEAGQAETFYVKGNRLPPEILYTTPGELSREIITYFDPY